MVRGPKPARCEVESGPRDDFVQYKLHLLDTFIQSYFDNW